MAQKGGFKENGGGSSTSLQVANETCPHGNEKADISLNTSTSGCSITTAQISVTSESELKVAGKLHEQLVYLQSTYGCIINMYDAHRSDNTKAVPLLNREQLMAGLKKYKHKKDIIRDHLFDLLEAVRPICLPTYEEVERIPKPFIPSNPCTDTENIDYLW